MEANNILKGLIEIYQNDFMYGYEGEDKEELRIIFLELIVEVTRYVNDYRYCNEKDCRCSPESGIKALLERYGKQINEKILGIGYGLSEVPLYHIRKFLNGFV
jgi:hypothetical protein